MVLPDLGSCSAECKNPCWDFMTVESTSSTTTKKLTSRREETTNIVQKMPDWTHKLETEELDNHVQVHIYFSTPEVTVVVTGETTPVMTFIGNIGGQLGNWPLS